MRYGGERERVSARRELLRGRISMASDVQRAIEIRRAVYIAERQGGSVRGG